MKLKVLLSILCTVQFHILGAQQSSLHIKTPDVIAALTDTAIDSCLISDHNNTFFKPGKAIVVRIVPDSTSFLNCIYKIDKKRYIEFPIIGNLFVADLTKSHKPIGFEFGDQLCVLDQASPAFISRDDFLPVFTHILSAKTTGITLYQTYRLSKD